VAARDDPVVAEPLIERGEIVGLLWGVTDISATLRRIEQLLEDDNGEEETDTGGT
jgi:hypothetical protein